MIEYELCGSWSCFAAWVHDFQILIAGLLAIAAGGLAYLGALSQAAGAAKQAKAAIEAAHLQVQERRRAAASALWSELVNCRVLLIASAKSLRDAHLLTYAIPLRPIVTPIFDSDPSAVGLFPADEAFAAANAYQMIKHLNDSWVRLLERNHLLEKDQGERIAQRVDDLVEAITRSLDGLRLTAGVSQEQAIAMIVRYESAPRLK